MKKELSIQDVLRCVFGAYRPMFLPKHHASKRQFRDARIFADGVLVFEGDIDMVRYGVQLEHVAMAFGVILELRNEESADAIWTSHKPFSAHSAIKHTA
jgi:hypothetical protein